MSHVDLLNLADVEAHLASHGDLRGAVLHGIDFRSAPALLENSPLEDALLLGCALNPITLASVEARGGIVFPTLPDLPYKTYRPGLYSIEELMEGYKRGESKSFADTRDGQIYAHFDKGRKTKGPLPMREALAQRLHDHSIDDALNDLLHNDGDPLKVVGIMGGHSMKRSDPAFLTIAHIAARLAAEGYFVVTGGGPGAMEAGNLGAAMSKDTSRLQEHVKTLATAPSYKDDAWFDTAYEVLEQLEEPTESLAIPTWFYGHEPSNFFGTHVAKYFSNSLREDGLLAIAEHGVIYAPGSAGTISEIFMDACQNHYGVFGNVSPMVFFGEEYWHKNKPVYPVLQDLAKGRQYGEMLMASDDVEAIVEFIKAHPPEDYRKK